VVITGYPSRQWLVAGQIIERNVQGIRPRAVFSACEMLLEHQRDLLERAFGCHVYNWYGTTECVSNIVECDFGELHVKQEHGFVEVLDASGRPVGAGEEGELVCTGFDNLAMPFIRYRTGDRVTPKAGTCACGRSGRLIERIEGRLEDVIVTPDGRRIGRLDHVFKHALRVEEGQIVQYAPDALRIVVVPRAGFTDADDAALRRLLRERVGASMRIELLRTNRIERSNRGKFRGLVNLVAKGPRSPEGDA